MNLRIDRDTVYVYNTGLKYYKWVIKSPYTMALISNHISSGTASILQLAIL